MLTPSLPLKGQCLCGAVTVQVTAPPILTFACHCTDCQKLTASAFSLSTMVPKESFTCEGELTQGGLKAGERGHYYCASCLTFVYSEVGQNSWRINLRTAVLGNANTFPPFIEIMTKDKRPWIQLPVEHSFSTGPKGADDLLKIFEAYAAQFN